MRIASRRRISSEVQLSRPVVSRCLGRSGVAPFLDCSTLYTTWAALLRSAQPCHYLRPGGGAVWFASSPFPCRRRGQFTAAMCVLGHWQWLLLGIVYPCLAAAGPSSQEAGQVHRAGSESNVIQTTSAGIHSQPARKNVSEEAVSQEAAMLLFAGVHVRPTNARLDMLPSTLRRLQWFLFCVRLWTSSLLSFLLRSIVVFP